MRLLCAWAVVAVAAASLFAACSVVNGPDDPLAPQGGSGAVATGGTGGGTGGASSSSSSGGTTPGCGDGTQNGTEECDEGGDTATCDSDCTAVACGDGHANQAAGEDCDEGAVDTATCDSDCTAVTCGDGLLNIPAGEQCEDGNADAGDGCSAACGAEGSCVQPLVLEMDDTLDGGKVGTVAANLGGISLMAAADCNGDTAIGSGSDRVYQLDVTNPDRVVVTLTASFAASVRVLGAPCDVGTQVAPANDDGCEYGSAGPLSIVYPVLEAGTYYIVVSGVGPDDQGAFTLEVTEHALVSCKGLYDNAPGISNGMYTIDPDGAGGYPPVEVYCDMASGGHTLYAVDHTWGEWGNKTVVLRDNLVPALGSFSAWDGACAAFSKSRYTGSWVTGGNSYSDPTKQVYAAAQDYFYNFALHVFPPIDYNNILILHDGVSANCWAHYAEAGSLQCFGSPTGTGYAYCRQGDTASKRYHIYLCEL